MTPDPEARLNSHEVRALCGGVSDMWLWRRMNEEGGTFPRPTVIGRRRFWRRGDVLAWFEAQNEAA
ncbi:transcriptional regulator [Rhodobacterales bacterium HKCCE3408]|nr:transcriptional regulator [Rhodobacterales bacterium HKCCE3408]